MNNSVPKPYALFSHSDQIQAWQSGRSDIKIGTGWGGRSADAIVGLQRGRLGLPDDDFDLGLLDVLRRAQAPAVDRHRLAHERARPERVQRHSRGGGPQELHGLPAHDRQHGHDDRRRELDDSAGARHQRRLPDGPDHHDRLSEHLPRQPAEAGRQGHQAQPDLARGQPPAPDLLRLAGRLRHASGPARRPGQQLPRRSRRPSRPSTSRPWSSASRTRSRPSRCRTSAARSRSRATRAASGRTTAGAPTSSSSATASLGGNFYGRPTARPSRSSRRCRRAAPDDTTNNASNGRGRWIPTTASDQYGAALAKWFGVSDLDMGSVFPNIGNFDPPPAFMAAPPAGC